MNIVRQDSIVKSVKLGKYIINSSEYFMDTSKKDQKHYFARDHVLFNGDMFMVSWSSRKGYGKLYGEM